MVSLEKPVNVNRQDVSDGQRMENCATIASSVQARIARQSAHECLCTYAIPAVIQSLKHLHMCAQSCQELGWRCRGC